MIWRFMRKLFWNGSESNCAIPIGNARLCVNCDSVIQDTVCPICASKKQLRIGNILGKMAK
jgi:hypothetical protein